MAIRYKNPQTGEYEVIKIPVMKGEQGHAGIHVGTDAPPTTDVKLWFDPSDTDNDVDLANRLDTTLTACYDYMGNDRGSIKAAADANVDWLLGEINTVHHDGQHITATDTIEGRSKSAILKGQTLVNVIDTTNFSRVDSNYVTRDEHGYLTCRANSAFLFASHKKSNLLKENTNYTLFVEVVENTLSKSATAITLIDGSGEGDIGSAFVDPYIFGIDGQFVGNIKRLVTTKSDLSGVATDFRIVVNRDNPSGEHIKFRYMLLEGDYTNVDIPYFEGMQSVQMPGLTTTGKNLFDGEVEEGIINGDTGEPQTYGGRCRSKNFIRVPKNTDLYIKVENGGSTSWTSIYGYDENKKYLGCIINSSGANKTFNTGNASYIKWKNNTPMDTLGNIQIEEGSTDTTYEPYKSNILTVNEDVELRGIGDVRDELDLLTGEVTQRVKEVILNGSESWMAQPDTNWNTDTHISFRFIANDMSANMWAGGETNCISDKFKTITLDNESYKTSDEFIGSDGGTNTVYFNIKISRSRLNGDETVNGLKQWLSQNPITLQYKVKTESIKTVDLSDNHVYSYKDVTHYDCSSEEGSLVPTLSIDVPTNLSALVTKQRQQIRTLEEENKELNQELQLAITSSEESDNELLAQSFELDFRLMEVECALDLPMAATFRLGGKAMAMTPYEMAKKLILAGNYDRADMEHKLDVYVSKKRMTEAERQELIQLMDEKEGIVEIDPSEPEVEESIIEHEAVTIPLH